MLLLDITRAWGSALKHVFSIAIKQQVAPADGIRIYGGSFLPTGILFLKAAHKHPIGKMLLEQDKCELAERLKDTATLAKLPANTLGKLYYDFYMRNLVDSDQSDFREYLEADKRRSKRPYAKQDFHSNTAVSRFFEQISYQHDLMHILGNHPFTIEGEATVHAFIIPHVRTPAPKLIAIVLGISQAWVKRDLRVISDVWKSYQRGRKAKWLYPVDWVQYLDRNIEEIRHEFKISIA